MFKSIFLQRKLDEEGHIYSSKYSGWYCVSDETFLTESQLKEVASPEGNGKVLVSAESGHPVEWTEEENYIFKLSRFQDDLRHWITSNGMCIEPLFSNYVANISHLPYILVSSKKNKVNSLWVILNLCESSCPKLTSNEKPGCTFTRLQLSS